MLFNNHTKGRRAAALILSLLVALVAVPIRAEIWLVGSDLLGPGLTASLEDYARRTDTSLVADFAGSQPGWLQLQDGRADLGLLAFPPGQSWPVAPFVCLPLAYHVTYVLVPESLPLEQLSWVRLAGIFGEGGAGHVARWGELGPVGDWTARTIMPRVCDSGGGLSVALFRHLVLHDGAWRPAVIHCGGMEALRNDLVQAGGGGIELAPVLPPIGSGLKALAIARTEQESAAAPTPENVHRGDYALRWPVCLVFRRTDVARLFPLLRHLLGEEVAHKCSQAGLMALPGSVREQQIFDLESW